LYTNTVKIPHYKSQKFPMMSTGIKPILW